MMLDAYNFFKTMNEEQCEFLREHKELAEKHAGYFFMTLHNALFSTRTCVDCLMDIFREIKPNLVGSEAKVQAEFYEDIYTFLQKGKKQQRKEICQLYEKYKRLWQSVIPHDISAQAIKVSIAYLFVMLGVEMPEPMYDFIEFNGKVYVDFDKVDTPSLEEAVKYLGYIPTDFSSPSVIANYYEHFSSKIYSLKGTTKKSIFDRLRKRKCKTTHN